MDIPPSLVNIYKELKSDLGISPAPHGCLESWAKQGVLLLNSVLTVRAHLANSHKNCGWQIFTDDIIKKLNERDTPIVFILWGANARSKKQYITNPIHYVIESAHPSPLSAYNGFSAASRFQGRTSFWKKTVSRRSNGKLRIDERKNRAVVQGCRQKIKNLMTPARYIVLGFWASSPSGRFCWCFRFLRQAERQSALFPRCSRRRPRCA